MNIFQFNDMFIESDGIIERSYSSIKKSFIIIELYYSNVPSLGCIY